MLKSFIDIPKANQQSSNDMYCQRVRNICTKTLAHLRNIWLFISRVNYMPKFGAMQCTTTLLEPY